jgi:hypothetical protein
LHAPQLFGSFISSTHVLLQFESPIAQQRPLAHVSFMPQMFPQPPQLFGSTSTSTQSVPHFERPIGHFVLHRPSAHTCIDGHTLLHAPQFAESPRRSLQTPEHTENPSGQGSHFPLLQSALVPHFVPQPPQLSLSELTSMQRPLQNALPASHEGPSGAAS